MIGLLVAMAIGITSAAAAEKGSTDPKQQLPDPDTKPAAAGKPVKVFILLGQSNMLGFGRVGPEDKRGTLEYLTRKEGRYPHLVDDQGKWTQRKDVRYVLCQERAGRAACCVTHAGRLGPKGPRPHAAPGAAGRRFRTRRRLVLSDSARHAMPQIRRTSDGSPVEGEP